MERSSRLAFVCLGLFLVLFPLALKQPGWPGGLKADEPAYFLMAESLAHDGDLRCDLGDLRRLMDAFPFHPVYNLILMTDDGWNTVYFGKPYLYSLVAVPLVGLFGASGMIALNTLLLLGMVWLGARYLARYNSEGVALLFASGFFLVSVSYAYVFWIHPEVFNMAAVMVCLYCGLTEPGGRRFTSGWRRFLAWPGWLRAAVSGAALSVVVYSKPMVGILGLAPFLVLARGRRFKELAAWIAGAAVSMGLAISGAVVLTGHPSAYLGVTRGGYEVCSPNEMPIQPVLPPPAPAKASAPSAEGGGVAGDGSAEGGDVRDDGGVSGDEGEKKQAAWSWIFHLPNLTFAEVSEHFSYFLWGRHTGLLLYFPFSGLALGLFAAFARRSLERWVLLASLLALALIFILWIPFNWHGGGGFVGNRYYVLAFPGFLFLVTRVRPAWIQAVAWGAGGLLLGPMLFTPLGRTVPWPTMQAHVRNAPFSLFPLELSLKGIPGYDERTYAGLSVLGRKDVFLPRGQRFWMHGATTADLWIRTAEPLAELDLELKSFALPNEVDLRLGGAEARAVFDSGDRRERVELVPGGPDKVVERYGRPIYVYVLEVTSRTGEVRSWTQNYPPRDCDYYPYVASSEESFYVGVQVTFLGGASDPDRDVFALEWGEVHAPPRVRAGATFAVAARVRNASEAVWPAGGAYPVALAYHWQTPAGEDVVFDGTRTALAGDVAPGAWARFRAPIEAPPAAGRYVLVLDLVYEGVAWFAERTGGAVARVEIEVSAAPPPPL